MKSAWWLESTLRSGWRATARQRWLLASLAAATVTFGVGAASLQPTNDLIIRNGRLVTAIGQSDGDLHIHNGTIAEIGPNLPKIPGAREIDARGMLVLPGGIDPHVHLPGIPPGEGADDYTTASRAALAGGTTTIGNFVSPVAGEALIATLDKEIAVVQKQTIADVILHAESADPSKTPFPTAAELAVLAARGFSMKFFLIRRYFDQNVADHIRLLRAAGAAHLLSMVHCEDSGIVTTSRERLIGEGRTAIRYFAESSPVVAEEVATQRAVAMSEVTGSPIYIVHLSSERALRAAEAGMARGLPIFVEARTLYLHLTKERFEEPDGGIYTGNPPLREPRDVDALWSGIANGTVHVVATDHIGLTRKDKLDPPQTIMRTRPAGNYLQANLPLLYSRGVRTGRITIEQFVAVTSTNPAKLFGLYPRKGTLSVGSDGDLAIWNPNLERTVRDEDQFSNAKFSIFSGWTLTGWPLVTIRRGEVVYENGKITGLPGSGRMAPRQRWQSPSSPAGRR